MSELSLPGLVASAGLAIGPLVLRHRQAAQQRSAGTPVEEAAAFRDACAAAAAALEDLTAAADDMAGEILAFQLALLDDEDLLSPVQEAIAGGVAADAAWRRHLDAEIAEYESGDDEYFRARAADLADLRDRVLQALAPVPAAGTMQDEGGLLAAEDLTPSAFLETDWRRFAGAALRDGSAASHVAMLARARGVPLLVGLGAGFSLLQAGRPAILDAEAGRLLLDPSGESLRAAEQRRAGLAAEQAAAARCLYEPAATAEGEAVRMLVNLDDPALLRDLDPALCDGVGLTRSEFLFRAGRPLPDEAEQYAAYRRVLDWAAGRPVVIRTLDAGGDKPIPGLTPEGEGNPFLGQRGLRLSLARPEIFRVQLRALARAAAAGPLSVMLPMVTHPDEMAAARLLFTETVAALQAEGREARLPPLGMMVEVPAAALSAADFATDFYSIGSNDLVQYATAAARDDGRVAALYDPRHPAIALLLRQVVEAGRATGRPVSLCGDMAGEPALIPLLLAAGLRSLSVAPARMAAAKAAVAKWRSGHG